MSQPAVVSDAEKHAYRLGYEEALRRVAKVKNVKVHDETGTAYVRERVRVTVELINRERTLQLTVGPRR